MEEINRLSEIAGLTKVKGMVQTLTFANDLSASQFKLVEMPSELLGTLNQGDRFLVIKSLIFRSYYITITTTLSISNHIS